ncbi:MAG: STAS domain-containing protein [Planctomycetota bacterium]
MINYTTYNHAEFPDVLVVEAGGKLDSHSSQFLLDCIQGIVEHGNKKVLLDCEDLDLINSMGLATLVRANSRLKKLGGSLAIANAHGVVADVLKVVHFDRLFGLYSSVDEAASAI